MKRARLLISGELLREVLHLPFGTEILGSGNYTNGVVEVFVEHHDLKDVALVEGECPPLVSPRFKKQEEVVFLGWGQDA